MKLSFTEQQILDAPVASGAEVFRCPDPGCGLPHILLLDDDDQPMAHYIITPELYLEIQEAMHGRQN
jgi:hypothetical protein